MKERIIREFRVLSNPDEGFRRLEKRSLEDVVSDYILILLLSSALGFLATVILSVIRAVYYQLFYHADIFYWNMLNYAFGIGLALFYIYLFLGTFGVFILTLVMRAFARKMRYVRLIKIVLLSTAPILLFGWIPLSQFPLFVWMLFLLVKGMKSPG